MLQYAMERLLYRLSKTPHRARLQERHVAREEPAFRGKIAQKSRALRIQWSAVRIGPGASLAGPLRANRRPLTPRFARCAPWRRTAARTNTAQKTAAKRAARAAHTSPTGEAVARAPRPRRRSLQ